MDLRIQTASPHFALDNVTPQQKVLGSVPNIPEYIQHTWYDWIWYLDLHNPFRESIGRWIGPTKNSGDGFVSHILTLKGKVICRSTTRKVTQGEYDSDEIKRQMSEYTKAMESLIDNNSNASI